MTAPDGARRLTDIDFAPGKMLFRSRVLALGFIPFDWTELTLDELEPGRRFVERSRMGSMHSWQHIRTIEPDGDCAILTDELSFEPKLPRPIARATITLAFRNRHRQLRKRFGGDRLA